MRRKLLVGILVLCSAAAFAAGTDCLQIFMKAKEQFRLGAYADSLATLDRLAAEGDKPGNETVRTQLAPGLAFYRGASLAALGRTEEAVPQLQAFLQYQPNASLDPSAFPPRVLAALEDARKGTKSEAPSQPSTGTLGASYQAFKPPVEALRDGAGEDWADGAVRYLLTPEQRRDYQRLSDPVSRSEYITDFWKSRDPKAETAENEARLEFERRVAFADRQFAQDETPGSLTDRGMVFVLLGAPTYIGRVPLRTGEDANDPAGMSMYSDQDVANVLRGTPGARTAMVYDNMTGPNNRLPDSDGNYRELWHYRRELLPTGISYLQVDFDFITRQGYGKNVLQRDARALATLEKARMAVRAGTFTRSASH